MKPKLQTHAGWLTDKHFPSPTLPGIPGKGPPFAGMCLLFGFCTRLITIPLMLTMLFIIFVLGHGKIFYEDQYHYCSSYFSFIYQWFREMGLDEKF